METWQIILAIIIVGLSIVMPIYYSYKKKKLAQQLKEGREVTEREKIRVYYTLNGIVFHMIEFLPIN